MNIEGVRILKDVIREPYAWPGGYEKFVITTDGGIICHECCKKNYKSMAHSTLNEYRDGWDVVAVDCDAYLEEVTYCDNCSKNLFEEGED